MAGHHHPLGIERRGGEFGCLGTVHRYRLLAQNVITLREAPERQLEVRRGRSADVDEVERSKLCDLLKAGQERNTLERRSGSRIIYDADDLQARCHPGIGLKRREMPGARDPSQTQEGALRASPRSEEHTSELQALAYLVCRL